MLPAQSCNQIAFHMVMRCSLQKLLSPLVLALQGRGELPGSPPS